MPGTSDAVNHPALVEDLDIASEMGNSIAESMSESLLSQSVLSTANENRTINNHSLSYARKCLLTAIYSLSNNNFFIR